MGSDLHIIVWAHSAAGRLADLAVRRVDILEQCWSRFRADSELNLLHLRAGQGSVPVSGDLHLLVSRMQEAHAWSDGDVDATVHAGMVSMGYDTDFATVVSTPVPSTWLPKPGLGMAGVLLHDGVVSLPRGVALDPGALGKGLAGDIVTAELASAGATAVLVSIGGDVVTHGTPPDAQGWRISLRDDRTCQRSELDVITLSATRRAVATSSILRRRWSGRHHVLDPQSGLPTESGVVQASVVADCGWRAEAGATLALVRGRDSIEWLRDRGCTAYLLQEAPAPEGEPAHA